MRILKKGDVIAVAIDARAAALVAEKGDAEGEEKGAGEGENILDYESVFCHLAPNPLTNHFMLDFHSPQAPPPTQYSSK